MLVCLCHVCFLLATCSGVPGQCLIPLHRLASWAVVSRCPMCHERHFDPVPSRVLFGKICRSLRCAPLLSHNHHQDYHTMLLHGDAYMLISFTLIWWLHPEKFPVMYFIVRCCSPEQPPNIPKQLYTVCLILGFLLWNRVKNIKSWSEVRWRRPQR